MHKSGSRRFRVPYKRFLKEVRESRPHDCDLRCLLPTSGRWHPTLRVTPATEAGPADLPRPPNCTEGLTKAKTTISRFPKILKVLAGAVTLLVGAPLLALFARGGCVDRSRRGFAYTLPHPVTMVDSNRPLLSIFVVAKVAYAQTRVRVLIVRPPAPCTKRKERGTPH